MSSLKVNYHKSMLVGVNVNVCWLNEPAFVMNCRVGQLPTSINLLSCYTKIEKSPTTKIGKK